MTADDSKMNIINGIFDPTDEKIGGVPVFRKRTDADKLLVYVESKKWWVVQPSTNKGTTICFAYISCDPVSAPHKASGSGWRVHNGTSFNLQNAVTISLCTQSLSEYQAMVEDARRRAIADCRSIEISGFHFFQFFF